MSAADDVKTVRPGVSGRKRDRRNDHAVTLFEPSVACAARAYLGLSQERLGKAAGVAKRTVFKLEKDGKVEKRSLDRILSAFERLGVVMLYDEARVVCGMEFHPRRAGGDSR